MVLNSSMIVGVGVTTSHTVEEGRSDAVLYTGQTVLQSSASRVFFDTTAEFVRRHPTDQEIRAAPDGSPCIVIASTNPDERTRVLVFGEVYLTEECP